MTLHLEDLLLSKWADFVVGVNAESLDSLDSRDASLVGSIAASSCILLDWSKLTVFANCDLLISLLILQSLSD